MSTLPDDGALNLETDAPKLRHDCKNVLTSIVLYANALNLKLGQQGDGEGAELASEIEALAKKLNVMIETLPE